VILSRRGIVLALVLVPFFVDQLNGLLQSRFGVQASVSQWVKAVYLVAVIPVAILEGLTAAVALGALVAALVAALVSAQFCKPGVVDSLGTDLVFAGKLLTFPATYFAFARLWRAREGGPRELSTTSHVVFLGIAAALALSALGYGDVNYGRTESGVAFGYRGYFIAGNELSGLFVLAYALALGDVLTRRPLLEPRPLAVVVLGLVSALLLVTKTALLGYALTSLAVPFLARRIRARTLPPARGVLPARSLMVAAGLPLAVMGAYLWAEERIAGNLERYGENLAKAASPLSFLFSGRLEYMADAWRMYAEGYSWSGKFLGCGWYWPERLNANRYFGSGSAEVDYLDLLVSVGVLGTVVLYSVWGVVLVRLVRAQRARPSVMGGVVAYAFLLLVTLGALSGHVMYSALAGFYLAVACAAVTAEAPA